MCGTLISCCQVLGFTTVFDWDKINVLTSVGSRGTRRILCRIQNVGLVDSKVFGTAKRLYWSILMVTISFLDGPCMIKERKRT